MKVLVRVYGDLRRAVSSKSTVELKAGAKLRDLILKLGGRVECSGSAFLGAYRLEDSALVVLVNGRNINVLNGVNTNLEEGDFITLMPVLVGG